MVSVQSNLFCNSILVTLSMSDAVRRGMVTSVIVLVLQYCTRLSIQNVSDYNCRLRSLHVEHAHIDAVSAVHRK